LQLDLVFLASASREGEKKKEKKIEARTNIVESRNRPTSVQREKAVGQNEQGRVDPSQCKSWIRWFTSSLTHNKTITFRAFPSGTN